MSVIKRTLGRKVPTYILSANLCSKFDILSSRCIAVGSGSETHSNNSSNNDGSKSELVKGPINSNGITGRRPDTLTSKSADTNGTTSNGHLYHQSVAHSKKDHPIAEVTYTRACDLQSKKASVKVLLNHPQEISYLFFPAAVIT